MLRERAENCPHPSTPPTRGRCGPVPRPSGRLMPMPRPFPPCPGVRHTFHDVSTGVRLHVAEAGPEDGPPVVLQHGWPQHWWCWRGVIPALAEAGHRVIAPA